jgi:sterol 3beta-glucosyltransferase
VTGYWHTRDGNWQPPSDLLRFLDQGQPPVFIGFGSMTMQNPARITQIVLEALRITGMRAVVHTGWAGLAAAENETLPENITLINYAPFTWLFERIAGAVIHGGAGAVHCAARAGVPTLVVPFLYDQFGWGKRIHELNAGPQPLPFKKLTPERLAIHLNELVNTPAYAAGAAALGKRVHSEDGISSAVRTIEQILKP